MPDERLDIVEILLDSNLKAVSTFEAILRWCNSSPDTPHGEAICAIEQLVREAMKGRGQLDLTSTKVDKPMRTRAEVERLRGHLSQAWAHGVTHGPNQLIHESVATGGVIKALNWVLGADEPGGFGEMLRELDIVGPTDRPS